MYVLQRCNSLLVGRRAVTRVAEEADDLTDVVASVTLKLLRLAVVEVDYQLRQLDISLDQSLCRCDEMMISTSSTSRIT